MKRAGQLLPKLLLIMLIATVFIAGCSNNNSGTNDPASTAGADSSTSKPQETEKPPEPITVEFWHAYGEGEEKVLLEEVLPKFNAQYPHITIKPTRMPNDNLDQQVLTAAAGGAVPDVMRMDNTWIPRMASKGVLEEVGGFPGFEEIKANSFEGPMSTNYYNGKYYGVPLDTNTKIAVYNKNLLELAGATEPPKTIDELVTLARNIKAKGKYFGITIGGVDTWNMPPWFWTLGGRITDPEFKTASGFLNGPDSIKALETIVAWKEEGLLAPPVLYEPPGTWEGLRGDQGAPPSYMMINEGPWFFTFIKEEEKDIMIPAKMPNGPDGKSHSVIGGQDLVIFKGAKQPEGAWTFIQFMTSQEIQTLMTVKTGAIPTLKSAASAPELKDVYYLDEYIAEMETALARTPSANWNQISDVFQKAMESAVRKEATPKEALDKAAAEIDALLK